MKPLYLIGAAAVAVVGFFTVRRFLGGDTSPNDEPRNDAAGPRLPSMPSMPRMPSMPGMPGMTSGAAPNMPQIGPQAPAGMFGGMWG